MPEEKSKVETEIKLVATPEVSGDASELACSFDSRFASCGVETSLEPSCLSPISSVAPEVVASFAAQTPLLVFKQALFKIALFTGVSLLLFAVPYMMLPGWQQSFNFPYVRTALVMLFTWNLIGAALFAHAQTRAARITAIALFGLPLSVGVLLLGFVCLLAPMLHGRYIGF